MIREQYFGGPFRLPEFFKESEALPRKGQRSKGVMHFQIGVLVVTGLANPILSYADGVTTESRGQMFVRVCDGALRQVDKSTQIQEERLAASWEDYLVNMSRYMKGPLARKVRRFWSDLTRASHYPPPSAAPTNNESFIMSWDQGRQHIEVEIFTRGHLEWFYCDRGTGLYEGSEGSHQQAVIAVSEYFGRLQMP